MRSASASAELPLRGGGGQHDGGAQRPAAAPEAPEHGGKGEDGDAGGLPHGLVIEGSATLALAIREPVIAPVIAPNLANPGSQMSIFELQYCMIIYCKSKAT